MKKLISIFLIMSIFSFGLSMELNASDPTDPNKPVPYLTYTTGPNNTQVLTQTAYEPAGIINFNVSLNNPQDIFVHEDLIYVADTGNKRIVKLNKSGALLQIIEGDFILPTGLFVDDEFIYVADPEAQKVFKYYLDGTKETEYTRPTSPLFGNSPYRPSKLVVGARGIMYIAGLGSVNGLIQVNHRGDFVGFFGTNPTSLSLFTQILKFFGRDLALNEPPSPTNVAIDEKGSVFTISPTASKQVKKFNIASEDKLNINISLTELQSIAIGNLDNIYILSKSGIIQEYDSYGNLIFSFGGKNTGIKRPGLYDNPVGIAVDSNNNLFILDQNNNSVEYLEKTDFTNLVHTGIASFNDGQYDVTLWEEVLQKNSMFALANISIGRGLFRQRNYEDAATYFKIAGDVQGYSDSFWQIRYNWMQTYLVWVILALVLVYISVRVLRFADDKKGIYEPLRKLNDKTNKVQLVKDLKFTKQVFKHPIDTFYDIKQMHKGSYLSATIIYILFILVNIVSFYLTSFIFRTSSVESYSILRTVFILSGIILLFVFSNYLVSTLGDGIGWFKDIYIATASALMPYVIGAIPLALLSQVFTLNESFLYTFGNFILVAWSGLLVILAIKSVHDYSVKGLIGNVILTLITMLIIATIVIIVWILFNQFYEFVYGIIKEAMNRV